jgi:hypothetical protein
VEELLKEADHVVLVCPQTPETTKLINADTLSLMKPTATLVNIARGPVVDTDALVAALKDGVIAAAGKCPFCLYITVDDVLQRCEILFVIVFCWHEQGLTSPTRSHYRLTIPSCPCTM